MAENPFFDSIILSKSLKFSIDFEFFSLKHNAHKNSNELFLLERLESKKQNLL